MCTVVVWVCNAQGALESVSGHTGAVATSLSALRKLRLPTVRSYKIEYFLHCRAIEVQELD